MAILQAILALIGKSAGKILNAIFGWAVRALFRQTSTRQQTFLSALVGAAVAWPLLLVGSPCRGSRRCCWPSSPSRTLTPTEVPPEPEISDTLPDVRYVQRHG